MKSLDQNQKLRILFWVLAVFLGICQTWFMRHVIFSDGISYIEVATKYLAGDWANAINPYWSPLYSWAIALGFLVLRPTPYWQEAVLHVVNFCAYLASLVAFELFLSELLLFRSARRPAAEAASDEKAVLMLRVAGYCSILFAGLSLVGMAYCSPDMISLALILAITALLMRFSRGASSDRTYLVFGCLCGLFFLARTAFAPIFVVCCAAVIVILWQQHKPVVRPLGIIVSTFLVLVVPFVAAISIKSGRFTIGEAGKLTYGWEVAGAARYAHWQGEPNDIGVPTHTTTVVSTKPRAYVFTKELVATYSPWFNPAFWYDGIRPHMKLATQLRVAFINFTCLANLVVRSPVFLSFLVLLFLVGFGAWWREIVPYWFIVLPSLASLALYTIVYLEKRYVAGNFLIVWMVLLSSVSLHMRRLPQWVPAAVSVFCILYTGVFVLRRQTAAVKTTIGDLVHRREAEPNISYVMADQVRKLGLHPSDRVAMIGAAVDADWARLDGLKIVGEIPLFYDRNERPFNNTLRVSSADIKEFWAADKATQDRILNAFREAGAKLVVADGSLSPKFAKNWPSLLEPEQIPKPDPETGERLDYRYKVLTGEGHTSQSSPTASGTYTKTDSRPKS